MTLDGIVTLGSIRARFIYFFETENWIKNLRNFHYKHDSINVCRIYIYIYIRIFFSPQCNSGLGNIIESLPSES